MQAIQEITVRQVMVGQLV
jgi:hypothetical protein